MPNLIRGLAIYFEIFGFFFPTRKPIIKKGIIFMKREKMVLIRYLLKQY